MLLDFYFSLLRCDIYNSTIFCQHTLSETVPNRRWHWHKCLVLGTWCFILWLSSIPNARSSFILLSYFYSLYDVIIIKIKLWIFIHFFIYYPWFLPPCRLYNCVNMCHIICHFSHNGIKPAPVNQLLLKESTATVAISMISILAPGISEYDKQSKQWHNNAEGSSPNNTRSYSKKCHLAQIFLFYNELHNPTDSLWIP